MLKSIGELLYEKKPFYVPFYQRGYRWEKEHVLALLNDLYSFYIESTDTSNAKVTYYSLQPLVIKNEEVKYTVVDGQQRLTTIFIILKAFENFINRKERKFSIIYDREGSKEFLENIHNETKEKAEENADFWYMYNAYKAVLSWIKGENIRNKKFNEDEIEEFMNFIKRGKREFDGRDINKNIRFIWYELPQDEDEFEVFIRLNIGKVPLTDAELIKSFLVSQGRDEEERYAISKEWNDMEYTLRDNEFYGFISSEDLKNRIEIVFQIFLQKPSYKKYELYEELIRKFEDEYKKDIKSLWKDIKAIFGMLRFWHQDREFYHLIGFLISLRSKEKRMSIVDIYKLYEKSTDKKDFRKKLIEEIKSKTKFEKLLELYEIIDNEDFKEKIKEYYDLTYGTSYKNKTIEDLLLLFNIATLINSSKDSYIKFSFYKFNNDRWSLEHITPRTDKLKQDIRKVIEEIKKLKLSDIEIPKNEEEWESFIGEKFIDEFFKEDENKDLLFNLTLLPRSLNSAIKNNIFLVKRNQIIEFDRKGEFIPIATKNVFLKYYSDFSKHSCDMKKWSIEDAKNYLKNMIESIKSLLGESNE
ncbi:DUF262 domain-containing protein [Desulfurobacterium atlanticum]|uniref:GmrSD restriction endonucleases N-terminal domain-containing protein n=1 Tax=Desulfurobacterium atlanticum TaxID=240169 RepID=A0A238Y374_9BACT|nr:DUF262 domain-containing protein [Desulfurobacterium atlanticum]SNR65422.1 Protein of unknown function [Desulfurobacterium atlanticum]